MRFSLAIMATIFASMANAEVSGWGNLYLTNTGGTRPMQVDPSDAQVVTAYVDGANGFRLSIICGSDFTSLELGQIGIGDPFMGPQVELAAIFDGEPEITIGNFQYSGGSYKIALQPSIIARISTYDEVVLFGIGTDFSDRFTLNNSASAIEDMRCFGENL